MRWKTTVILLLVTVAVGAYVSRIELKRPLPEERERLAKRVVDLAEDAVAQVVLELPKVKTTLTRSGTVWRMGPHQLRADPDRVARVVGAAASLTAERVLNAERGASLDPGTYGLRPAQGILALTANGTSTTLLLGALTAVGGNRYVQVAGRPAIFIVPSHAFDEADQPLDLWRDPTLLRFNAWEAQELTLRSGQDTLALARGESGWRLTRPVTDRAESAEVDKFLARVADLRIARFLEDAPADDTPAEWGLDQPAQELSVRLEASPEAAITVLVGRPLPADPSLRYARRSDERPLYAVSAAAIDSLALAASPTGLRARAWLDASREQVTKVQVERDGASWAIAKTAPTTQAAGAQQAAWILEGANGETLEASKVETFLDALAAVRAERFLDETGSEAAPYGFESPAGTLTVWLEGRDQPERLVVGTAPDGTTLRYARFDSRQVTAELPGTVMDLLAETPEQLRPASQPVTAERAPESGALPAGPAAAPSGG
jgi:hypothetical protein